MRHVDQLNRIFIHTMVKIFQIIKQVSKWHKQFDWQSHLTMESFTAGWMVERTEDKQMKGSMVR